MLALHAPKALRTSTHSRVFPATFALAAALCVTGLAGHPQDLQDSTSPPPAGPIAIVPVDTAANVIGASRITLGRAFIYSNGSVTSGPRTTEVLLPRRGTLRICASTTILFSTDKSVPANETPGLMMALDHGAVETSFATGRNSDILLTPDFRILIGGPGASEVKVRLGDHGDTCVDNPGAAAPYVLVSSVFDGGAYRVQPGQRVMFQRGSLRAVVDQEKEPCGCPAEERPNTNDFPLAQSAGLAPLAKPDPPGVSQAPDGKITGSLIYAAPSPGSDSSTSVVANPTDPVTTPPPAAATPRRHAEKKSGLFHSIGRFFRRLFGAE
jgi:hypothetical protein